MDAARTVVRQRGEVDAWLGAFAAVRNPRWSLKSVSVKPGLAALTLIGVSRSSFAYMTVIMFSAAFDDGYCTEAGIWASGWAGSLCIAIEPTSLDTLTIRAAGERRSSGSIALVTATTPKTLISYTARMSSSEVWLAVAAAGTRWRCPRC